MGNYDNSKYAYEQILAGVGYYMQDDLLRISNGVKIMQQKLNEAGYLCGTADGRFGSKTDTAVRDFQSAKGLTVDGKAVKATLTVLDSATAGHAAYVSTSHDNSYTLFKQKHGTVIKSYADRYDIDENILGGFVLVESSGSGFTNGKVKIRLENHHFLKGDACHPLHFTYNICTTAKHTIEKPLLHAPVFHTNKQNEYISNAFMNESIHTYLEISLMFLLTRLLNQDSFSLSTYSPLYIPNNTL